MPHGTMWLWYVAKVLSICRKINCVLIKEEFFASYISVYKNYGMRNTYAPYVTPKNEVSLLFTANISVQTIDETGILPIKFSCHMAFYNIYTIFSKATLCCILLHGIVWTYFCIHRWRPKTARKRAASLFYTV